MKHDPNWMHAKYAHIRIPKLLIADPAYKWMMPEAKYLYGLLMDRSSLSETKGDRFRNEKGETTIIFTQTELQDQLSCGHDKATKLMRQLEDAGLIRRRRIGCGRPYEIVVVPKDWTLRKNSSDTAAPPQPEVRKIRKAESGKSAGNNPDTGKPDRNSDIPWQKKLIEVYIKRDELLRDYPAALVDRLEQAVELLFSTEAETFRIGELEVDGTCLRNMITLLDTAQLQDCLKLLRLAPEEMQSGDILGVLYGLHLESAV